MSPLPKLISPARLKPLRASWQACDFAALLRRRASPMVAKPEVRTAVRYKEAVAKFMLDECNSVVVVVVELSVVIV